jgi:hypothetical protein
MWPPAGFFHHCWGSSRIVDSTTIPAHGHGGSGRSSEGRSGSPDGGDSTSRGERRGCRGGRFGIHDGGAPSAEPAAKEVVATAGAAAAEVAGAPSSSPQPAQEDVPEVVYGRHLLPSPMEVPLPRLLVKA